MIKFLKYHWPLLLLIPFFSFLFFFRFDWPTLASWDEAWYGAIARTIAETGNFLLMTFNGKPYFDHPPVGFIIMALSIKLFGVTAFAVRFPSVLMGVASIVLIYLTAYELFKKRIIGVASALVLGTSVWYVIRVRAGDLDSPFIFFYLLTMFMSLKSSKKFSLFPLTCVSFALLVLTKTLVGWSAGIQIFALHFKELINVKKNWRSLILGAMAFIAVVLPWYYVQNKTQFNFMEIHFFRVGMRGKGLMSYFKLQPELPLFYLHMGVRKWYYLWLAATGLILLTFKFLKKPYFIVLLWNFVIFYPFMTSNDTHIWHLIPVYMPMALLIGAGVYWGKVLFVKITKLQKFDKAFNILYILLFVALAGLQIKNFYKEVYYTSIFTPHDVDVSQKVAQFKEPIYLDDDFYPIAVYYSGRQITSLIGEPDGRKTAVEFFKSEQNDFVMITRNYILNLLKEAGIDYRVRYQNESFSIISKPTSQP